MKLKTILICALSVLVFVSCKKDSANSSSAAFEGTWTFTGIHSETVAQNIYSESGNETKTITYSTYDSKNNTGTIKFANGTATGTGLGYSVDTTLVGYFYDNNVLIDSTSEPFTFTAPASNSTSSYKLVDTDSVSFTGQGLVNGGSTTGSPSGGHYSIADGRMTISTSLLKDSVATDGTATLSIHETADVKIYLQK